MLLAICAWHEPRQRVLPGFTATHGICPYCFELMLVAEPGLAERMKRKTLRWPQMLREQGWTSRPSSNQFPEYRLDARKHQWQMVVGQGEWHLYRDLVYHNSGTLEELLEDMESILSQPA